MAKNANFVSHKKSKQIVDGKPKLPLATDLVEGEIAINFGKDVETLSIKNESGTVVTFSSDNYYTEQKLGTGFTGENSGVTVTEALENFEITVDQDFSNTASTNPISTKAVYSAVTDNELVWTNAFVALSSITSAHTANTEIHVTSADKEKINSIGTLSGTVTAHTANTDIHVTAADKEKLHTHSNKAALDSITGNVGTMAYEDKTSYSSATEVNTALGGKANITDLADFFDDAKYELSGTTHVINFYNGNTIKATIDATDFIKDGMIDSVSLETTGGTTYLVITWNTDAGKSQTSLNVGDLFDADNYYTKTETSGATELQTAFNAIDDLVGSGFTSSSITDVIIENERIVSNSLTDLDDRKLDASAYTPTDLTNYYTKSETSGATEISNAFNDLNTIITAHTADTSIHVTQALLDRIAYLENKVIYNGHAYVEIGGLKWATMNIGASQPSDYGLYFAWGDTQGYTAEQVGSGEGQKYFGWADYKYGNGTSSPGATGMTKYNATDGLTTLEAVDDAAVANWGGSWRMPTTAEFQALGAAVNTAWTQVNNVYGILCTDKTDSSKTLFFPAAGYCGDGGVEFVGDDGFYWSSSLYTLSRQYAYYLYFYSSSAYWDSSNFRYFGFAVRPVVG